MACLLMVSGCSTTQFVVKNELPKYDKTLTTPCPDDFVEIPDGREETVLTATILNMQKARECVTKQHALVKQIKEREKDGKYVDQPFPN